MEEDHNKAADEASRAPKAAPPSHPHLGVVHPLVLLSVVDHYHRLAKDTRNRVVGVLLGEEHRGVVDITNCYAVPFDEDLKNPNIWFLDHDYHETMAGMLRRVTANEKVVGWYSSGPGMKPNDLDIHRLFMNYCKHPVFIIVDVNPKDEGIPTDAYVGVETIMNEGEEPTLSFHHIGSEIGAQEVEEIGVEHLLRDVKDTNISSLTTQVHERLAALSGLKSKLEIIHEYLINLRNGRLKPNHHLSYQLQNIMNLLPTLRTPDVERSLASKTNDMSMVIYLSSIIRSILALHNLINNKISMSEKEKPKDATPESNGKESKEDSSAASSSKEAENSSSSSSSDKPSK